MKIPGTSVAVAAVLAVPLLGGCGAGPTEAPRQAAETYMSAWQNKDGAAVCDLLAPETRSEVEQSAGKPCQEAVVEEELPAAASVLGSEVWGDEALVRLDTDTLFLAEFRSGWKIVAAGCRSRGDKPYDCQVQGG